MVGHIGQRCRVTSWSGEYTNIRQDMDRGYLTAGIGVLMNINMAYNLCFSTTNVRGLSSELKRKKVFACLKQKRYDICFLQETHSTEENEVVWQQQWGFSRSIFFSHGTNLARGVAIIIRRGLDFKVERSWRDRDGRCLIMEVTVNELRVLLVNLYSPNDIRSQIEFYERIRVVLTVFNTNQLPIFVGGDFNVAFDPDMDKAGGIYQPKRNVMSAIRHIQLDWNLVDCWREVNPLTQQYTWHQPHPLVKCRLDYWLVPATMMHQVLESSIARFISTDHKSVLFRIQGPLYRPRGPGIWRLNSSVLQHESFRKEMEGCIQQALRDTVGWDPRTGWDYMKMMVRDSAMRYCSELNSRRTQRKLALSQAIDTLESKGERVSDQERQQLERVQAELDAIFTDDARRAILRTRVRWLVLGEKPNRYFLGLEKRNSVRKTIARLVNANGEEITSGVAVLDEIHEHFRRIYSAPTQDKEEMKRWFDQTTAQKRLKDEDGERLDRPLVPIEYHVALKEMTQGKAPGRDGLPVEWYVRMWDLIQDPLVSSLQKAIEVEEMSVSQRQGVITLLPKPGKDTTKLDGWRPITLLNCDYKILAKALATRVKRVLTSVINENQTGFVAGRYIGENIRIVLDIVEALKERPGASGLILSLDFEKAFDTISWDFMIMALERKKFGPGFISAVRTLYQSVSSEVTNNGFISDRIELFRGIRQGCPLSPYLFIISIDFLYEVLLSKPEIQPVRLFGHEYLISQYADDTTLFLKDKASAEAAFDVLETFGRVSGLRLNKSKTQCLGLGPRRAELPSLEGVQVVENIKILGITVGYNGQVVKQRNFEDKLHKMDKLVDDWSSRRLTVYGKVLVWNQLLGSLLIHSLMNLAIPEDVWTRIGNRIQNFIWEGGQPKIRQDVMIQPHCLGGVRAPDIVTTVIGLRLSWLRRLLRDPSAGWTRIGFEDVDRVGGLPFLLRCNFDFRKINVTLPQFYASILDVIGLIRNSPVREVNNPDDLRCQLICNNRFVLSDGKSVYEPWLRDSPLAWVINWLDDSGRSRSWTQIQEWLPTGRLVYFRYLQIISAIPRAWRQMRAQMQMMDPLPLQIGPHLVNGAKERYIANRRGVPAGQAWWFTLYPEIGSWDWKAIWRLPMVLQVPNKFRWFQFKVLHRTLAVPAKLFLWGRRDDAECNACGAPVDNIEHTLVLCPVSATVWRGVLNRFQRLEQITLHWTTEQLLFGFLQKIGTTKITKRLNIIGLLVKNYLYSQRRMELQSISAHEFNFVLRRFLLNQWHIAQTRDQVQQFEDLWQLYL